MGTDPHFVDFKDSLKILLKDLSWFNADRDVA